MIPNTQPIEKPDHQVDGSLEVHSCFYTLQGEGPFTGQAAVFLRLAGCNLQCPWCDTEYTSYRHRLLPHVICALILEAIPQPINGNPVVVITGGEPFRQNLVPLLQALDRRGYRVQIESNGVLPPPPGWHTLNRHRLHVVISPKTSRVHPLWDQEADTFKYVLNEGEVDETDLLPLQALGHKATPRVARPGPSFAGHIYVNPMDAKDPDQNQKNLELVARAALRHNYIAGVQLHKLMGLE